MSVHWTAAMISPIDDLDGAPLLRTEVVLDPGTATSPTPGCTSRPWASSRPR